MYQWFLIKYLITINKFGHVKILETVDGLGKKKTVFWRKEILSPRSLGFLRQLCKIMAVTVFS